MSESTKPNIVFLIWDACRFDYASEHAPNLTQLGENGAWFENAIAPGTWSLPSHASMFTGKYPHEHGVTQPSQTTMPATLVERLKTEGYSCYGVSGNGFTSSRWGFDEELDYLRFTQGPEPYGDGKEMYGSLRGKIEHEGKNMSSAFAEAVSECITHEKPLKSTANLISVAINHASRDFFPQLQNIPRPVFRAGPRYAYSGAKNTASIREILRREADTDDPFFLFSNYMETHRPYIPDDDLQQKHLGETLSWDELVRLNEEVAESWNFVELVENGDLNEDDVRTLRALYAGEVEAVDRQLGIVLDELGAQELLDETLVVVTADHGEMLGEEDVMGERRFGHQAAMSENLSRVPMVVAHPQIRHDDIQTEVSLRNLFGLFLDAARDSSVGVDRLLSDDVVLCEYPALGDEQMYEAHPGVSRDAIAQRVTQDAVSAHAEGWHAVANSDGDRVAERNGEKRNIDDLPERIGECLTEALSELSGLTRQRMNEETRSHLEDLGYM